MKAASELGSYYEMEINILVDFRMSCISFQDGNVKYMKKNKNSSVLCQRERHKWLRADFLLISRFSNFYPAPFQLSCLT